jgi:hypothetical protein
MAKKTLADKLADGIVTAASQAEKDAAKQALAKTKSEAKHSTTVEKLRAKEQKEMKKLSKLFTSVSEREIIKALAGDCKDSLGNKVLTIKTWSDFSVIDSLAPGHGMWNQITDTGKGGKKLSDQLNEVAARVAGVSYSPSNFTPENIENAFIRNEVKLHLSWDKDKFETAVKRQAQYNIM